MLSYMAILGFLKASQSKPASRDWAVWGWQGSALSAGLFCKLTSSKCLEFWATWFHFPHKAQSASILGNCPRSLEAALARPGLLHLPALSSHRLPLLSPAPFFPLLRENNSVAAAGLCPFCILLMLCLLACFMPPAWLTFHVIPLRRAFCIS